MKPKHPLADLYAEEIERVRKGDVAAAQMMMLHCAVALREQQPDGRNNLAGQHAEYLAEVLERLAQKDSTAKLFCLDMPGNRPKQSRTRRSTWSGRGKCWRSSRRENARRRVAGRCEAGEYEHRAVRRSWKLRGISPKPSCC